MPNNNSRVELEIQDRDYRRTATVAAKTLVRNREAIVRYDDEYYPTDTVRTVLSRLLRAV